MKETVYTRLLMMALVVSASLLFATCGSRFQLVLSADLEPTSLKLNVGEMGEFTPVVNSIGGYSVTWESSDPTVASVDDNGMVTAKNPGKTEITATFTDSIAVTVPVEVVESRTPEPQPKPDPEAKPDLAINLGSTLKMAKGSSRAISTSGESSVTWSSGNEDVAVVRASSSSGDIATYELYAVGPGRTTITATSVDYPEVKAEMEVIVVVGPTAIAIREGEKLEVASGSAHTLTVTATAPNVDDEFYDDSIVWKSSNPDIVSVHEKSGKLSAGDPGTITVRARSIVDSAVSAEIAITVVAPPDTIRIEDGEEITLYPDETRTLSVELEGPDGFDGSLVWSSEESAVVTVDPTTGELTARSPGTTRVTASSTLDPEVSDSVTVTVENNLRGIKIKQGKSVNLCPGESSTLEVEFEGIGDFDRSLNWLSEDGDVVSVDATGKLTAGALGTTTVTVRPLHNEELYATILVSVEELSLLSFGFKLADNSFTTRWDPDFGDYSQPIPEAGEAIVITFPLGYKGVDFSKLVPSFETIPGAEVYVGGQRQTSGENSHDFSGPVPVIYTLKKGASVRNYSIEVRLELFLVPDATFRDYLKGRFPDAFEGELLDTTAASVRSATEICIYPESYIPESDGSESYIPYLYTSELVRIGSVLGIEFFPALERFQYIYGSLGALDVSKNPALKSLNCFVNNIRSLDVSKNPALEILICSGNSIGALDVSKNPELVSLACSDTDISALDVSKNPALVSLLCSSANISALDVSSNPLLEKLWCYNNELVSLNVRGNPALTMLVCGSTGLTSLDLSRNPELKYLDCSNNSLKSLDLSGITALVWLYCAENFLTTLDASGMRGFAHILDINAGEVSEGTTYNPLTTLIIPEDLRNHDEINETIKNRGSALSVTYVK